MNCVDGTYKGATCTDDSYGLMYWNPTESMYEKRTGYLNDNGNISYNIYGGKDGGYDLPKSWFNDKYNSATGKYYSKKNIWPLLAIAAVVVLIVIIVIKKLK